MKTFSVMLMKENSQNKDRYVNLICNIFILKLKILSKEKSFISATFKIAQF